MSSNIFRKPAQINVKYVYTKFYLFSCFFSVSDTAKQFNSYSWIWPCICSVCICEFLCYIHSLMQVYIIIYKWTYFSCLLIILLIGRAVQCFFFFTLSKSVRSHEEKYQATLALNGQFCFILFLYRSGISSFPYMGISETWRRGLVLFGEARRGAAN